jgi:hypothetical protein
VRIALCTATVALAARAAAQEPCEGCVVPPAIIAEAPPGNPAPPQDTARARRNILFRFETVAVYSRAIERDFGGVRFAIDLGYDGRAFAVGWRPGIQIGATQSGLAYQWLSWGAGIDGKLGRVRLGVEPHAGMLLVTRATNDAPLQSLAALTLGVYGECIVALIGATQPRARPYPGIDLIARGGYDHVAVTDARPGAAHSGTLQIGVGGRY